MAGLLSAAARRSNTAYGSDDYSAQAGWIWREGAQDVRQYDLHTHVQGWSCHDPRKDIVIPAFKSWDMVSESALWPYLVLAPRDGSHAALCRHVCRRRADGARHPALPARRCG